MLRNWTNAVWLCRMPDLRVDMRTCQRETSTWSKLNTRSIGFISWTPMSGPCRRKFLLDTSIRWAFLLFLPNTCILELPNINIILRCQVKLKLTMLLLAASPSYNELHGQVQAGRTALTQTTSRHLHLYHQHCHEPSRYTWEEMIYFCLNVLLYESFTIW